MLAKYFIASIFTFLICCFRSCKQIINVLANVKIHNLIVEVWSNMAFFINIYFFSFSKTNPPVAILIHQSTSALKEMSSESKGTAYLAQTIGSAFSSLLMTSVSLFLVPKIHRFLSVLEWCSPI